MAHKAVAIKRYPLSNVFMTMLLQPPDFPRKINWLRTPDLGVHLGVLLWQNSGLPQLTQDAGALSKQISRDESAIIIHDDIPVGFIHNPLLSNIESIALLVGLRKQNKNLAGTKLALDADEGYSENAPCQFNPNSKNSEIMANSFHFCVFSILRALFTSNAHSA
jgi:hypothetical protein